MQPAAALCFLIMLGTALAATPPAVAPPNTTATGAGDESEPLTELVVTATRVAQTSFNLPVSVDRVDAARIRQGQSQVNLSESLVSVPGISIESRQNYAQDLQLSIRGFGARSSFGVRGVRLYSDGIPGTMPDGQGQFSQFDLGSADHIEVLRGPFSALYGNSSGGVIAIYTEDGPPGFGAEANAEYGSFGTQRYALEGGGDTGTLNYIVDAAHFHTDGYRDHSLAERNLLNSKLRVTLDDVSKLTLVLNAIETPAIRDPLGLTSTQLASDPEQAGTNAIAYNTRKSLSQSQLGVTYERQLTDEDELVTSVYGGERSTTQYQAIPASTEKAPTNPGGVIDLQRSYGGADAHLTDARDIAGTPLQLTAGASYDELDEHRRGFLNFIGTELGVEGALRRWETNLVHDLDQYLQAQWDPLAPWRLIVGVRNSVVDVSSHNHLPSSEEAPLSGVHYAATNPVAGVIYRVALDVNVYAAYGKGFETPTLNDLAYRSTDGSLPGLNYALQPARSDNYELGVKTESAHWRADLAAFYIRTHDELAVLQNAAGRSVEQNIGETERKGMELGGTARLSEQLSARLAYTYLHAVVVTPYATCFGTPCMPTVVPAGNRLPAVPQNALYAALTWRYPRAGLTTTLETFGRGQIYADDRNTEAAAGYWSENLRLGFEQESTRWRFSEFLRVENLTDRRYVGTVIVNESNFRYFEPAPGRTAHLMLTAVLR
jgi:iron complex outermembrane receptor protein